RSPASRPAWAAAPPTSTPAATGATRCRRARTPPRAARTTSRRSCGRQAPYERRRDPARHPGRRGLPADRAPRHRRARLPSRPHVRRPRGSPGRARRRARAPRRRRRGDRRPHRRRGRPPRLARAVPARRAPGGGGERRRARPAARPRDRLRHARGRAARRRRLARADEAHGGCRRMTRIDDKILLRRYHEEGDLQAREQLIEQYMSLVRSLARRYSYRGEQLEDLVQIGAIGLIKAIDRFDIDRGVELTTYATPNIIGEIKRHFRDKGWAV